MTTSSPFCKTSASGLGYVMGSYFMTSWGDDEGAFCSLLWFKPWTLDTLAKYVVAIFGVFFLAMATVLIPTLPIPKNNTLENRLLRTLIYGVTKFGAYMIMLVTMMYETYLMLAVILGLMAGYFVLISYIHPVSLCEEKECSSLNRSVSKNDYTKITESTPCCQCEN